MAAAHLEGAYLLEAHLEGAALDGAHLEGASLMDAHLEGKNMNVDDLERIHKWNSDFPPTLHPAQLNRAFFNTATELDDITLGDKQFGFVTVADVRWDGVNLANVNWTQVNILGDEFQARSRKRIGNVNEFQIAVRANRQLAVALQSQGLNEEAARFAYRAQVLYRSVLWQQILQKNVSIWQRIQKLGSFLLSSFLYILSGYGYRPGRSLISYLVVIFGFMGLYLLNSHFVAPHLSWDEALVLSVSSFHGRGFFSQNITLGDAYARLAAFEAFVGLLIEVSLIATFTQRFFTK